MQDTTYWEYLNLEKKEPYDTLSEYINPKKELAINGKTFLPKWDPLIKIPFGIYIELLNPPTASRYKDIPNTVGVPQLVIPRLYRDVSIRELYNTRYFDIVGVFNWIKKEIENIQEWEKNVFGGNNNATSVLDKFGIYNLIYFIAGGDILKEDAVLELPYRHVLIHIERKLLENRQ